MKEKSTYHTYQAIKESPTPSNDGESMYSTTGSGTFYTADKS